MLDATRAWSDLPIVIIDFETTGPDPATALPVSVGAVRLEAGVEVRHFYSLINPGVPIPAEASAIHGISDADVVDAPTLEAVALELYEIAADAVPCAYNGTTYDRTILHRLVSGSGCPLFDPAQAWIDPLVMIRKIDRYVRGTGRHRLSTTCERWGVQLEGEAHNALTDCRAVAGLLVALVRAGKLRGDVSLARLLEHTERLRAEQEAERVRYLERRALAESADTGG